MDFANAMYGQPLMDRSAAPTASTGYEFSDPRGTGPQVNEAISSSVSRGTGPTVRGSVLDDTLQGYAEGPDARELSGPSKQFGAVADANGTNALAEQDLSATGQFQQRFADEAFSRQMSLEDPLMQRDKAQLDTQLRNQGLRPDSEAYQNAMGDLDDQQGEMRSRASQDALRIGSEEQSRQFDREATTRQQGAQEVQQQFDRRMASGSMQDQQRYQQFNEQQTIDSQRFDQELKAAGFNDGQRQQMVGERLADSQQQFMQELQAAQFQEQQRAADFSEQRGNSEMQFAQQLAAGEYTDAQRAAGVDETLRGDQQRFGQQIDAAGFQNDERARDITQRSDAATNYTNLQMDTAGFQNDERNRDISQRLDATGQIFDQDTARSNQNFDQNLTSANYQNQLRQAQIAESLQQRGMGINEINALLSGNQVNMPNMPSFNTANRAETTQYNTAAQNQGTFENNRYATALGPVNAGLQALGSWGT